MVEMTKAGCILQSMLVEKETYAHRFGRGGFLVCFLLFCFGCCWLGFCLVMYVCFVCLFGGLGGGGLIFFFSPFFFGLSDEVPALCSDLEVLIV